ncbi:MAG: hypothetical protein WC671_01870 [Candidatus Paceibacterota bacterium]|jgi:hypothetical protein
MKKLNEYKYIILIVLIILGFSFYWYSYKPQQIRKGCDSQAFFDAGKTLGIDESLNESQWQDRKEKLYKDCLRYEGLDY